MGINLFIEYRKGREENKMGVYIILSHARNKENKFTVLRKTALFFHENYDLKVNNSKKDYNTFLSVLKILFSEYFAVLTITSFFYKSIILW